MLAASSAGNSTMPKLETLPPLLLIAAASRRARVPRDPIAPWTKLSAARSARPPVREWAGRARRSDFAARQLPHRLSCALRRDSELGRAGARAAPAARTSLARPNAAPVSERRARGRVAHGGRAAASLAAADGRPRQPCGPLAAF
eukprot:scaffold104948_cov29-Tisochrysis_lutea.AAC.5